MDRGTWWAIVHRISESQTQLKQLCVACTVAPGTILNTTSKKLLHLSVLFTKHLILIPQASGDSVFLITSIQFLLPHMVLLVVSFQTRNFKYVSILILFLSSKCSITFQIHFPSIMQHCILVVDFYILCWIFGFCLQVLGLLEASLPLLKIFNFLFNWLHFM